MELNFFKLSLRYVLIQCFLTFLSREPNLRNMFTPLTQKRQIFLVPFFRSYLSNFFQFYNHDLFFNSRVIFFLTIKITKDTFPSEENLMKNQLFLIFLLLIPSIEQIKIYFFRNKYSKILFLTTQRDPKNMLRDP